MISKLALSLVAAALAASGASTAEAAQFHFTISGGYTAAFDLDDSALPDYYNSTSFEFHNVGGSFAGTGPNGVSPASTSVASLVQFYSSAYGGGIGISADNLSRFVEDGAQLYSGSTSAPSFVPGTYILAANTSYRTAASVLTISQAVTGAVPEPASWAFMVLGCGAVGGMLRRSKVRAAVSYA